MSRIITLTTDFGLKDAFVGVMKGVILSINPQANIIDITHEIPSQDILEACFLLYSAYGYFPRDSIHVVVVDPGVGSDRRVLCVETSVGTFLAPDNGVLSLVLSRVVPGRIHSVTNRELFLHRISSTFHGRDIFAPVAAHLSNGVGVERVGELVDDAHVLAFADPTREGSRLVGEVLHIDRFGNLITNIHESDLEGTPPEHVVIRVGSMTLEGLRCTYADVRSGSPLALIGSSWHLEIAVNKGSAAALLHIGKGERVEISLTA